MIFGLYETIWDERKILFKDFIILFFKLAVLTALPRVKIDRLGVFPPLKTHVDWLFKTM